MANRTTCDHCGAAVPAHLYLCLDCGAEWQEPSPAVWLGYGAMAFAVLAYAGLQALHGHVLLALIVALPLLWLLHLVRKAHAPGWVRPNQAARRPRRLVARTAD